MSSLAAYALNRVGRALALRALFPLVREGAATTWVDVAMEGEWHGHAAGPFRLDRAAFEAILANFARQQNPIPVDYEHATEWANEAPAAGWVQKLEVRDGDDGKAHLWALVELTDKAADYVREGAYRYSSGVFVFDAVDRQSGEDMGVCMHSLALTNSPFIDGQEPIRLTQRASRRTALNAQEAHGMTGLKIPKEALMRALELIESEEVSLDELQAAAHMAAAASGELKEPGASEAPAADKPEDKPEDPADKPKDEADVKAASDVATVEASDAQPVPAADDMGGDAATAALQPLMQDTGMDMAALAAAIMEKRAEIAALLVGDAAPEQAPLSDEVKALKLQVKTGAASIRSLTARAETAEKALDERRRKDAEGDVDTLVREGKILDSLKDDYVSLALSNRPQFDRITASLPQVVPVGDHAASTAPEKTDSAAPIDETDELVISLRRTLTGAKVKRAEQDRIIRQRIAAKREAASARPSN